MLFNFIFMINTKYRPPHSDFVTEPEMGSPPSIR